MQKASFITENYIGHSQNLLVMVSWVLYLDCSRWSVPYIYTMQVCTCLNLISGQQQVVNIFGPVLHHGGQLPVLAVQVLLSCLHVLLTLLSLPPHDPGPASAPYAAPGAPLHGPWPRASPGLGWPEEQQEEEGGDRTHDGRGREASWLSGQPWKTAVRRLLWRDAGGRSQLCVWGEKQAKWILKGRKFASSHK